MITHLMLQAPEGIPGSSGRNISVGHRDAVASGVIPCDRYGMAGFLIIWRRDGFNPSWIPAANVKCVEDDELQAIADKSGFSQKQTNAKCSAPQQKSK